MIGIVDYGLGNVKAFANIYSALDVPFVVARTPDELSSADKLILPGVGAFDQAMHRLQESGMREELDRRVLQGGVPVLGVCVGMQILMRSSSEGSSPGLSWVDGDVVKFEAGAVQQPLHVPHMGWNDVQPVRPNALLDGLAEQARFYFLHSYFVRCNVEQDILARTRYGSEFACALNHANIYGVQFHPEKSHGYGIQLLKNFAEL